MDSGQERGPRLPKTVCAPSSACTFEYGPSGSPRNARTRAWSGNWRRVLEDESTCMFEDGRLFHVLNTLQLRDNAGESAAAPKHGFESRWGHQIVFVEVFRAGFPSCPEGTKTPTALHLRSGR